MRMIVLVSVYAVLLSSCISLAWGELMEFERQIHAEKIEMDFQKGSDADLQ
jgi:hypothetical protein